MTATQAVDLEAMGWYGNAGLKLLIEPTARLARAITEKAAELGLTVSGLDDIPDEPGPGLQATLMIETGDPKRWLAADKLRAYIDGLTDALAGTYGNPPVEVGRRDLERVVGVAEHSFVASPEAAASVRRLRQVLAEAQQ